MTPRARHTHLAGAPGHRPGPSVCNTRFLYTPEPTMGALHPQFPYITESEVEASPLPFLLWTGRARARLVACHSNPLGAPQPSRFLYISYGDVAIHIRCGYP